MTGMSNICGETQTAKPMEAGSASARKRRQEIHRFNYAAADEAAVALRRRKRLRGLSNSSSSAPYKEVGDNNENIKAAGNEDSGEMVLPEMKTPVVVEEKPKYGMTSVCGRRRDMEDSVAIHPYFCKESIGKSDFRHFYGVYDGHGCSHVAMKCKDRMHEIIKDELEVAGEEGSWKETMTTSFIRMDKEITEWSATGVSSSPCRCGLQSSQSDAVGSTAVVAVVTPEKIVVSNCGDSRAVLCRSGTAVPLSVDHKPDRPDELARIEAAGGRVIYWDGARVLGVLAMSRAIGDNYLKPFVIPEPEVSVTDRTSDDECLILASDGLWDVVSNETACNIARMCLQARNKPSCTLRQSSGNHDVTKSAGDDESCSDRACRDASSLLTKLALSRHSSDNVSVVVVDLRKHLYHS